MYRARLKGRTRARGEPVSQLAHEMEMVPRAYLSPPDEMVVVLACNHFVDALGDQQLQIYMKQVRPEDMQMALARALEFEPTFPCHAFRACRTQTKTLFKHGRMSSSTFKGTCWGCD